MKRTMRIWRDTTQVGNEGRNREDDLAGNKGKNEDKEQGMKRIWMETQQGQE